MNNIDTKNSINKNKRIYYLDFLKAISIILVIYVHYPWINESKASNISMCITIIAVPLFFMVNGTLMLMKKLDIKKHFKKIIIITTSCIIWKILIFFICLITKKIEISNYKIYEILLYLFTANNLKGVPTEHFWFLYALIKIYIIYPFVYMAMKKDRKYLIIILVLCVTFSFGIDMLNKTSIFLNNKFGMPKISFNTFKDTYNPIGSNTQYLSFFILGYLIHTKFYDNKKISIKNSMILMLTAIIGIGLIFFTRYIQVGSFFDGQYTRIDNDYSNIGNLILCITIFTFFSIVEFNNEIFNKIVCFIGSRTINIYYIHMLVLSFASEIHKNLIKYNGAKVNLLRTLIVFTICIVITEILKLIKPVKKLLNLS